MEDKGSELIVKNSNKEEQVEVAGDASGIPLPEIGTTFMIDGNEFRVCYVNEGKRRFSAEPYKGKY